MHLKIRLGKSERLQGIRGIFADQDIREGEIIEECPVILVPNNEIEDLAKTVMTKYEFVWDSEHEAVVLGYGSLYNHDKEPNAEFEHDFEKKTMIFRALRDIKKDEELLISYHQGEDDNDFPKEYIDFLH